MLHTIFIVIDDYWVKITWVKKRSNSNEVADEGLLLQKIHQVEVSLRETQPLPQEDSSDSPQPIGSTHPEIQSHHLETQY